MSDGHKQDNCHGMEADVVTCNSAERVSRRSFLSAGAAAAALGGVAISTGAARAQGASTASLDPWAGRRFRGLVVADGSAEVTDLELIAPIGRRQIIIATEATQASYSNTPQVLLGGGPPRGPAIPGYLGVGRVVHIGEAVSRVQVGDRVLVGVTPQCGQCYNCLHGRADMCQFLESDELNGGISDPPFARIVADGREVTGGRNGFSELMVATEEWLVPLFTDLPASALSLLGSVGATGLAAPTSFVPVQPGSDVVVFGCGPIGLSMVNGAAIMGANTIIAIEPIAYRREAALAMGATHVIDPTGKDDTLIEEIRALVPRRSKHFLSGGRGASPFPFVAHGPDYIFEATGSQLFDPSLRGVEPQPDPSGVREILQIFELCPGYGTMVTTGVRWDFQLTVPIPALLLTNTGKRLIQGQNGGSHLMRDVPRMVNMMERGQYKYEQLVSAEYLLEEAITALENSAYRTKISSHVVYDPAQFLE